MENNFLKSIDFKSGHIAYNGFYIDRSIPLTRQKFLLQEDMLQVNYGPYVVDVGWYPSINPKGRFVIYLIYNSDWGNPIRKVTAKNLMMLKGRLLKVIDYCEVLISRVYARRLG